jgi:hypothetical protein
MPKNKQPATLKPAARTRMLTDRADECLAIIKSGLNLPKGTKLTVNTDTFDTLKSFLGELYDADKGFAS